MLEKTCKNKLRVLVTISTPGMGGIENQVLYFLEKYDHERFIVDVVCGRSTDGALRDKYIATGTQMILCRWSRYVIPYVWRMIKLLRHGQYDVVHAHSAEVSGAVMLAAKIAGVPVRIASYDHIKTHWRNPGFVNNMAVGILQGLTRLLATRIYGDAVACLDVFFPHWRKYPEQFQICYDGIDIARFNETINPSEIRDEMGLPIDSLVVGHVGGFRKVKNHQTFVNVAELVSKHFENVHFLLVGDGELQQKIKLEVTNRGLKNRFVFAGNRQDVPRMLAAMDVFLMPSLDEGFGLAVAEAQLAGLCIVASNLPGISEAMYPKMREFCCEPLDFAKMSEHVIKLLEAPELRSRIGREAREYVTNNFSIDKTVEQLENDYESLAVNTCHEKVHYSVRNP